MFYPAENRTTVKSFPYILSILIGAGTWWIVGLWSGIEEAWDGGLYWSIGIPAMAVGALCIGIKWPSKPWRWGLLLGAGQAIALFIQTFPDIPNLWPVSLVIFAVLSLPLVLAAWLGSFLRRKRSERQSR